MVKVKPAASVKAVRAQPTMATRNIDQLLSGH
jgi:hypothetical protein